MTVDFVTFTDEFNPSAHWFAYPLFRFRLEQGGIDTSRFVLCPGGRLWHRLEREDILGNEQTLKNQIEGWLAIIGIELSADLPTAMAIADGVAGALVIAFRLVHHFGLVDPSAVALYGPIDGISKTRRAGFSRHTAWTNPWDVESRDVLSLAQMKEVLQWEVVASRALSESPIGGGISTVLNSFRWAFMPFTPERDAFGFFFTALEGLFLPYHEGDRPAGSLVGCSLGQRAALATRLQGNVEVTNLRKQLDGPFRQLRNSVAHGTKMPDADPRTLGDGLLVMAESLKTFLMWNTTYGRGRLPNSPKEARGATLTRIEAFNEWLAHHIRVSTSLPKASAELWGTLAGPVPPAS
jgi:hypothetical protein